MQSTAPLSNFFDGPKGVGESRGMQSITKTDTLETVNVKLKARKVVLMRLTLKGHLFYASGSRTDTFRPAVAYGRSPDVAIRRLADCLAPHIAPAGA